MEIIPLGDSALILRLSDDVQGAPEKALTAVGKALRQLETARIPGVIELAPAYGSIAMFFDPTQVSTEPGMTALDCLTNQIERALGRKTGKREIEAEAQLHQIPVCYEAEFALDLETVAAHAKLTADAVVQLHCGGEYRVHCIGFMPGFPYLGGLPSSLVTPRRVSPRKQVPAGSVAIGGVHTGIYPAASPGGWNIIGRTPVRLFAPKRDRPALLHAGDRVRFRQISADEFPKLAESERSP